jgi:hypothetical protein
MELKDTTLSAQNEFGQAAEIVSVAYKLKFGRFPMDGVWTSPEETWPDEFKKRISVCEKVNQEIISSLKNEFSLDSDAYIATYIFSKIASPVNQIASKQFSQGYSGRRCWREVSVEQSEILKEEIFRLKKDPKYTDFLTRNKGFLRGMEFLGLLIEERDFEQVKKFYADYILLVSNELNNGKPIIFISHHSDYKNPAQDENHSFLCEANATCLFPPAAEEKDIVQKLDKVVKNGLEARSAKKINNTVNIIGNTIASAGFEIFSQSSGERLDSGTFFLSLNVIKNNTLWKKVLNLTDYQKPYDRKAYQWLYRLLHERCHDLYPAYNRLNEVCADIPAIIEAINIINSGLEIRKQKLNLNNFILDMVCEFTPELMGTDYENQNFQGYRVSAQTILSTMFFQGVLVFDNKKAKLVIDSDQEKVKKMIIGLEEIHKEILASRSLEQIINSNLDEFVTFLGKSW